MFAFICFISLSSVLASDASHLKSGALTAHLGRFSLVEDVLWVKYPYTALNKIPSKLKEITEQLNKALNQLEIEISDNASSATFIPLLRARFQYINNSIELGLESYADLDVTNRTKRGLIDGMGKLYRMLFGTAMNEDVEDLRENYNQLASIASSNNKAINLNCKQIARFNQHVDDLAVYSK